MGNDFKINLDGKPALTKLKQSDVPAFKEIVGTFVNLMEVAAEKNWHKLPQQLDTSLSFDDIVTGILNAVMTTSEINPEAYSTLENDIHPLALLSDNRKSIITGESEYGVWRKRFAIDSDVISREVVEHIIRKILYLVRWFDIDKVSEALMANQFPVIDDKDIMKLPFQPALMYQKNQLGNSLYVGKFLHEIGAYNCGELDREVEICPACNIGKLEEIRNHKVCPRCNSGFALKEELEF